MLRLGNYLWFARLASRSAQHIAPAYITTVAKINARERWMKNMTRRLFSCLQNDDNTPIREMYHDPYPDKLHLISTVVSIF